jgi:hypothetical protein
MPPKVPSWGWDDPFRSLNVVSTLLSSAGMPSISAGVTAPYRTLFTTLQRLLVGRQITVRIDRHDVAMTVTEFDSPLDPRGLAVGQLGEVRLAVRDMRWDQHRLDRAAAVLRNVHVRPGVPPMLVAAPVELSSALPAEVVDAVLRQAVPGLRGELNSDGTARLHWARRPTWGGIDVDVAAVGSTLWLTPRALVARHRRWSLPAWLPAYPVRLPALPRGLLVTDVGFEADSLRWSGLVPEWRMELPELEDIIAYMSQRAGALSLAWPSLRRSPE